MALPLRLAWPQPVVSGGWLPLMHYCRPTFVLPGSGKQCRSGQPDLLIAKFRPVLLASLLPYRAFVLGWQRPIR